MTDAHAAAVLAIYQAGIDEGNATFETRAPGWEEFTAARLPRHRLRRRSPGPACTGWVAASPVSGPAASTPGVVEHSVYVHPAARGQGIGRALAGRADRLHRGGRDLDHPVAASSRRIPPAPALHRAAGFRVVGTRERIAQHHGRWRDTVLIERRSPVL